MSDRLKLTSIPKLDTDEFLAKFNLKASDPDESVKAAKALLNEVKRYGTAITVGDYINLSVRRDSTFSGLELVLNELGIPTRESYEDHVVIEAANDVFDTYPGTRALFPEVINDTITWVYRQPLQNTVADILAGSRGISGNEMISTEVEDDSAELESYIVPERGRIPITSIKTTQNAVKIWKLGHGIGWTYEFARRARLDLIAPFVGRIQRRLEEAKMAAALSLIINGDTVRSAATEVNQDDYDATVGVTSTDGKIHWECFLYWLVQRAKAGTPVDTVIGNWDAAFQWHRLWSVNSATGAPDAQNMAMVAERFNVPGLKLPIPQFVTAPTAPPNKLIGILRPETLEEVRENGSDIEERQRYIETQEEAVFSTTNVGYRIIWGDTRQVYDFGSIDE